MQNSAIVLRDEDGNSVVTDLEEVSTSCEQLTPAAINVENSSDVIIGPVTQFNGPVTIYQNVRGAEQSIAETEFTNSHGYNNGKLLKSESTSSDTVPEKSEKLPNKLLYSKHLKYVGIFLLVLIVLAVITTATILSLNSGRKLPFKPNQNPNEHDDDMSNDDVNNDDDILKPAGPGLIIDKEVWGGRPTLNGSFPLLHPTPVVIISHTVTPICSDLDECSVKIQSIQTYHVSKGSPDIGYNFIIGGDGNAYVGRGWDVRNFHTNNSIGISFIGNYVFDYLTAEMIDITKKLLQDGVKTGKLSKNYTLVAHNQTWPTESPGAHIYEVIKTWPHFRPGRFL